MIGSEFTAELLAGKVSCVCRGLFVLLLSASLAAGEPPRRFPMHWPWLASSRGHLEIWPAVGLVGSSCGNLEPHTFCAPVCVRVKSRPLTSYSPESSALEASISPAWFSLCGFWYGPQSGVTLPSSVGICYHPSGFRGLEDFECLWPEQPFSALQCPCVEVRAWAGPVWPFSGDLDPLW